MPLRAEVAASNRRPELPDAEDRPALDVGELGQPYGIVQRHERVSRRAALGHPGEELRPRDFADDELVHAYASRDPWNPSSRLMQDR